MLCFFRRLLRGRGAGAAPRHRQPSRRTRLTLERLEARDLPTVMAPMYVLEPTGGTAAPFSSSAPAGYTPAQVAQAYGFNQISFNGVKGDGSGQTIAIVDAYDDPNIQGDLRQFDRAFGLPDPPSFSVVNQNGGGALPSANSGWANEIALDVEWAHAMAPGANILLVETNTNSESDLFAGVRYAAAQPGVSVVSMSWGSSEFSSETSYDSAFTTPSGHQGVSFVISAGDKGAPASYPATSPNVLAVGGTSLYLNGSGYGSESAWGGSGGGLSAFEGQPSYQKGVVTQSGSQRGSPDVAYVAAPNTGMAVYNSYSYPSAPWIEVGGTSAGAPQWAALVAIADQGRAQSGKGTLDGGGQLLPALYRLPSSDFHDVTSGASAGSPSYPAGPGYDLATGLGSPYADRIAAALAQVSVSGGTHGPASSSPAPAPVSSAPGSTSGTGSQPAPTGPVDQTAHDALLIVEGYRGGNVGMMFSGLQDFQSLLASAPSAAPSLIQTFYFDLLMDLWG